jgi:hypothetical protein
MREVRALRILGPALAALAVLRREPAPGRRSGGRGPAGSAGSAPPRSARSPTPAPPTSGNHLDDADERRAGVGLWIRPEPARPDRRGRRRPRGSRRRRTPDDDAA